MYTIMCYGDSLTWGYVPGTGERFPFERRWTGLLQKNLGKKFRIIEESLNGRTTVWEDAFLPDRDGRKMLRPLLESHSPIDLIIIMLGTNDMQPYRNCRASESARGCKSLIEVVQKSRSGPNGTIPEILLVAPPPLGYLKGFMKVVFEGGEEESHKLPLAYQEVANFCQCHFFDSSKVVVPSKTDGAHLDEVEQLKFAIALRDIIKNILCTIQNPVIKG